MGLNEANAYLVGEYTEEANKTCPIKLDKVHCQNCYFDRQGKCAYDKIMNDGRQNTHDSNK